MSISGYTVYAIFFLSGAAALTYEISWSRQIGLLFGNTASAAATVLASYFVGLALGYALAGRLAGRTRNPLAAYGVMEFTAAIWTLLIPTLIQLLREGQFASFLQHLSPSSRTLLRAAFCILLFLPATTALGATLPLMARWVDGFAGRGRIALAYGVNTFGGLAGVLLATIVLLSQVGVVASSYLAAAVAIGIGLVAIVLSYSDGTSARVQKHREVVEVSANDAGTSWLLAFLVGLSGFITLALEVLYTRLFALTFHNSTYTFGLVISVVLFGLAVGAWIAALAERRGHAISLAGWSFLLAAGAISFSTLLFLNQTGLSYFRGGTTFSSYMAASVGFVALIVLPPSLLLGTVLPLLWNAACRSNSRSKSADLEVLPTGGIAKVVGRMTAVNTLSAAGGALAASFVLLPTLGLWASFTALATGSLIGGVSLLAARRSLTFWATAIACCCLIIAAWRVTSQQLAVPERKILLTRTEGAYGWVDVLKDKQTGSLSLRENINYTHGSTASAAWERRQSHIPLLIHPQPKNVLYLGSGTGATAGGAVMHDEVESIVVAELIPEVIDAARMFEESNLGVFEDSRTEVHIDDARHYLLATDRKFDVIIADLFVPWESKTGYLYTVDHYAITRERLAPGGLFCHWLPMWQLGQEEFEMIADSLATAFPHTTLWWGKVEYDRSIIGLIGSNAPLVLDGELIDRRLENIYANGPVDSRLNRPIELGRRYIGTWEVQFNATLNTDEHPRLEFAMPLTYANRGTMKLDRMQTYFDEHLSRLTADGVKFLRFETDQLSSENRRAWQRLQLRK